MEMVAQTINSSNGHDVNNNDVFNVVKFKPMYNVGYHLFNKFIRALMDNDYVAVTGDLVADLLLILHQNKGLKLFMNICLGK